MKQSRILAGAAAVVAFLAVSFFAAGPAQAATSTCSIGYITGQSCIHWGQSYNGSQSGVTEAVENFPVSGSTSYVYLGSGSGQGQFIGNNNGSNRNLDTLCYLTIWYNPASGGVFSGISRTFTPYPNAGYQAAGSGLGTLLNNIRGQTWSC